LFVLILLALLAAFNVYALTRPFYHEPSEVTDWRKGPLVKHYSPYATYNAAKIVWPVMAVMLDGYILLLTLWSWKLRSRVSGRWRSLANPLAALLALLGVMILGEAISGTIIHKYFFLQYHPDPELYWYNRPNLRDHTDVTDEARRSTNSLGFRISGEVPERKAAGEYRIFIIGDSSTFGLGINDHEAYAMVLERTLHKLTGRPIRVINSACPGHTSFQGMRLFMRYGRHMKPDLLLRAYNNDSCLDMVKEKDRVAKNPGVVSLQRLLYKSDLYLLARRVVLDAVYSLRLEHYRKLYSNDKKDWVRRIPFDDYQGVLQEFNELTRAMGIHFINLRMPLNHPMCEKMPIYYTSFSNKYRDYLGEFSKAKGVPYINFESQFGDLGNSPELFLPGHLFHPSVKGHRLIGERLARFIVEQGLMKPPPGSPLSSPPVAAGRRRPGSARCGSLGRHVSPRP